MNFSSRARLSPIAHPGRSPPALGLGALSLVAAGGLEQHGILSVHDGLGFLGLALFYVWVLAASVLLLRRARRSRHARRHDIRAANSSV